MSRRTDLYVIDGERIPSVTEVMGITGLTDFTGVPIGILEIARRRGSDAHEWIDLVESGHLSRDVVPPDHIAGYVAAYFLFKEQSGFEVEESELVVVDQENRVAGTLDLLGYPRKLSRPDDLWVIDTKCVAQVSKATRLQLTGYTYPLERSRGIRIRRGSLQLKRDGTYRLREYSDHDDYLDWFGFVRSAHFQLRNGLCEPLEA